MKKIILTILINICAICLYAQNTIIDVNMSQYFNQILGTNFTSSNYMKVSSLGETIVVQFAPTQNFRGAYDYHGSNAVITSMVNSYINDMAYPWIKASEIYVEDGEAYFIIPPNSSATTRIFYLEAAQGYAEIVQLGTNSAMIYSIVNNEVNYKLPGDEVSIVLSGSEKGKTYTLINESNSQTAIATKTGVGGQISFNGDFGIGTFRIKCGSEYMSGRVTYSYPNFSVASNTLNTVLDADGGELYFWMHFSDGQCTHSDILRLLADLNNKKVSSWNISHIGIEDYDPGAYLLYITYGPNIRPDTITHNSLIPLVNNGKLAFKQSGGIDPNNIIWDIPEDRTETKVTIKEPQKGVKYVLLHEFGDDSDSQVGGNGDITLMLDGCFDGLYTVLAQYGSTYVKISSYYADEPQEPQESSDWSSNWVKEITYIDDVSYFENIAYYDGLGRTDQIIEVGAVPIRTDASITPIYYVDRITPIGYDNMGRQNKSYLPFWGKSAFGSYQKDAVASQQIHYDEEYGDRFSFTEKEYDSSPLQYIKKVWNIGNENRVANAYIRLDYGCNHDEKVLKMWVEGDSLKIYGSHHEGYLHRESVTNEVGCTTHTYTDSFGRTVLVRTVDNTTSNGIKYHDTYYAYDYDSRLCWVVTPKGSMMIQFSIETYSMDSDLCKNYCYVYRYDDRGNVIGKRNPGSDWVEMVYDYSDRLVAMQDHHTKETNQWHIYYYDQLNRLQWIRLVNYNNSIMSSYINSYPNESPRNVLSFYVKSQGSSFAGISNLSQTESKLVMQYQYDNYNNIASALSFTPYSGWPIFNGIAKGCSTYEKVAILDADGISDNYVERAYYYDDEGRVIQIAEKNHCGGISCYSTRYDFVGNVLEQRESHTRLGGTMDIKSVAFKYDKRGNLLSEETTINNGKPIFTDYCYDKLGHLKTRSQVTAGAMDVRSDMWLCRRSDAQISPLFYDYMAGKMATLYGVEDWSKYNYILQDGSINPDYLMITENNFNYYYFPKISGISFEDMYDDVFLPFKEYSGMSSVYCWAVENLPVSVPYVNSVMLGEGPLKTIPLSKNIVISYDSSRDVLSPLFRDFFAEKIVEMFGTENWEWYEYILEDGSINPEYLISISGSTEYFYFPEVGIRHPEDLADYILSAFSWSACRVTFSVPAEFTGNPVNSIELNKGKFHDVKNITETYDYDIRGWLTGQSSDYFDMKLRYYHSEKGTPVNYNSNVTEWEWQYKGDGVDNTVNTYAFTYDKLDRLLSTDRYIGDATTPVRSFTQQGLSYDLNGNILSQKLYGADESNPLFDISYNYWGNLLTHITNADNESDEFTYDGGGNCTYDALRNLDLEYNLLNLMSKSEDPSKTVTYRWLADGSKLSYTDENGNGHSYLGSFIYDNGITQGCSSVSFSGGRFFVSEGSNGKIYTPHYFITDHLGSTRAVVAPDGTVLETNNYYPFGQLWDTSMLSGNTFKFSGKEEMAGDQNLPYLDFGARSYDPLLGRWLTQDPLAALFPQESPYSYVFNNPINLIDLFGLAAQSPNEDNPDGVLLPEVTITAPRVDPWDEWSLLLPELEFAPDIDDGKDIYGNSDWEYYIPIWGSSLKADISFQQGLYFDYIGWILWGVAEGLSFGSLSLKGLSAKSTVSTAAKANAVKVGTNGLNKTISVQKQARHVAGTAKSGGGFLNSTSDAQSVLNAVHSGKATFLGTSKAGHQVYLYNGVTGTNVNLGAGITGQPTNVFIIKGTTSPSVVPTSPLWKP